MLEKVQIEHGQLTSKIGAQYTKMIGNSSQLSKLNKFKSVENTQLSQQRAEISQINETLKDKDEEL